MNAMKNFFQFIIFRLLVATNPQEPCAVIARFLPICRSKYWTAGVREIIQARLVAQCRNMAVTNERWSQFSIVRFSVSLHFEIENAYTVAGFRLSRSIE